MPRIAIYPGSFDPITIGHAEIMQKASRLFDKVYVVVCVNPNKPDASFSADERVNMIRKVVDKLDNVQVDKHKGTALSYAEKVGACAMIRGVRNTADFANEITQYHFNHNMNKNVETVILFPDAQSLYVSSSSIKELATIKADFSQYVPSEVYAEIKARLG